ncbi:MAG: hypothetical protein JO250_08280 [Armatimonadetes bacterium]|nr:hypothetical protein [Armatimonadota bacterium]
MSPQERPGREAGVWPPPPTSGPPTVAVPPPLELRRGWVFWQIVGRMTLIGLALGMGCGALFGLVLAGIIGMIFGAFNGAIGGLLLGLGDGLVLATVTCAAFFPLRNPGKYRLIIGVGTALLTLVGGMPLSSAVSELGFISFWSVLSTLIAVLAACAASQIVARWYAAVSSQG